MLKGFTLVELIIAVVVIGILASFAVPQFAVTKERALEREALSVLGIIGAAEKAFNMEEGRFFPTPPRDPAPPFRANNSIAGTLAINQNLRLDLPVNSPGNNLPWIYRVATNGPTPCTITATRISGSRQRTLSLDPTAACPNLTCTGVCFNANGCI